MKSKRRIAGYPSDLDPRVRRDGDLSSLRVERIVCKHRVVGIYTIFQAESSERIYMRRGQRPSNRENVERKLLTPRSTKESEGEGNAKRSGDSKQIK